MRTKRILVLGLVAGVTGMAAALWAASPGGRAPASGPPLAASPSASAPASQPDKELTLDLGDQVTMRLVLIPAGKFMMGSAVAERTKAAEEAKRALKSDAPVAVIAKAFADEDPQHEVTISRPFHMGMCEVTKGQFARFIADSGYKTDAEKEGTAWGWDGTEFAEIAGHSWRKTGFEQTDDHPVVNVSWNDAAAFCEWASKKTGRKVSLPTEAQWEYACRARAKTACFWGEDPDGGKGSANAADQSAKKQFPGWSVFSWDDGYVFTAPVGKFKPNAFGLHDMVGNAWEWCADWYDKDYYANANKTDPAGPVSGTARVLRGGGWHCSPQGCRSAFRYSDAPVTRKNAFGFRVSVDLK